MTAVDRACEFLDQTSAADPSRRIILDLLDLIYDAKSSLVAIATDPSKLNHTYDHYALAREVAAKAAAALT